MSKIWQSPFLEPNEGVLVLDTSVILNLLASGVPSALLRATTCRCVLVQNVIEETKTNPATGLPAASNVNQLAEAGDLQIVPLHGDAVAVFRDLVTGALEATLDDGEAATIAHAVTIAPGSMVALDDKKAIRIASQRWPAHPIASSISIFRHWQHFAAPTHSQVSEALFAALQYARMRVPSADMEWVHKHLSTEQVGLCPSLPTIDASMARSKRRS